MWRCCGRLHASWLRGRWALTVSPTGVAVRLHGAPTAPPCECHAQRHWDYGKKQLRLSFGASGTCWPPLGGASGMLHRTGVVVAPRGISGDGSDAATRREVEETRRPKWTMSSTIKDILLEGSTLISEMKLNDFLRRNWGEEWAVERNGNVAMGAFVFTPRMFIQDEGLLGLITAMPSYQELKMVLEAISKLHLEGVVSLGQWRDYERKDTVTPFARGKINRVLTQVQIEEKRAIREEEEERLRRMQEMKFTISTTIEDALFKGDFRYKETRLNNFLTTRLGGKGVVDTNQNVLLGDFLKDPARYIRDAGVLNEIQASDAYLRMEIAVRDEMIFQKDVSKLCDKGVNNLLGWSKAAAEVKAGVHNFTKHSLDAALREATNTTTEAAMKLEGLYESVYDAR
ncbi:retrotransposon hot spot (RHS) protein, putative [Trypanosoma cruzi marinkellei]|uniref:Retrotransposon hot spot (RHS) protein, putative n=1 Tax=Trypanosoma cruzi marinkellei TaxID=85056 RepID=K2NEF5_TRYCR|nr:retrotransposon hot spot (RHS) protein, putative [Trypanosoma cruzi marinkellei]